MNSFNPAAAEGVMCRDTVSVGWDGRLYDCDFNQQLALGLRCARGADLLGLGLELGAERRVFCCQRGVSGLSYGLI